MAIPPVVTLDRWTDTIIEPGTGRKFTLSTNGAGGDAADYRDAKAALTVGTWCSGTHSIRSEAGPAMNAGTQFSDVVIILGKNQTADGETGAAVCNQKTVTLRLENVTTDIALQDDDGNPVGGVIDGQNGLVQALADAYRDGNQEGGYRFVSGYFTK